MSSPAPAATPRSVRILHILVIAVLAGGLALAAGIGIGRYAMGSRIADVVGHRLPDDGWADGAARTWEATIGCSGGCADVRNRTGWGPGKLTFF